MILKTIGRILADAQRLDCTKDRAPKMVGKAPDVSGWDIDRLIERLGCSERGFWICEADMESLRKQLAERGIPL